MKPKSHLINPVVPTTVQTVTSVRDNSPESMDVVQEVSVDANITLIIYNTFIFFRFQKLFQINYILMT